MKAIAWSAYGKPSVLNCIELEKPTPKNNEILVKVFVSSVTTGDARLRSLNVPSGMGFLTRLAFGIKKPRKLIPGMEFSGEVVSVGDTVTQFKIGDRVFGTTGMNMGAHAEYTCINENHAVVKIPDNLSYKNAVSLMFGGLTAIHFLRNKVGIKKDDKVLINGASSAVGTAAIQLAKYYGAEVTGVCSESSFSLVTSLGADGTIDYTQEDFTQKQNTYDVILDTVGNVSFTQCQQSLTPSGKAILINTGMGTILHSLFNSHLVCGVADENKESLNFLIELYNAKKLIPVIDKTYPLEKIVDAHTYVDKRHKKGNVLLTIA